MTASVELSARWASRRKSSSNVLHSGRLVSMEDDQSGLPPHINSVDFELGLDAGGLAMILAVAAPAVSSRAAR
ncbi:MAG: hypothetical protein AAGI88_25425 [Pseudomonadota bacterium]